MVGEGYLGVTERQWLILILTTQGGYNSLPGPVGCWPGVADSVTGEAGGSVDEAVMVMGQRGYERFMRQPGCLHHDLTTAALPHDGEGRHTEGVGLAGHQASHGLL